MNRFTLIYRSAQGTPVRLFNLAKSEVDRITQTQTSFGSTDFRFTLQARNYSQMDIDLIKSAYPESKLFERRLVG